MHKSIFLGVFLVMLVVCVTGCVKQIPFEERLDILKEQLEDDDPLVREAALIEIGEYGPDADIDGLVRKIIHLLSKDVGYVRATAIWATSRYQLDVDLYQNVILSDMNLLLGGKPELENAGDSQGELLADMLLSRDVRTRLEALDAMVWEDVYPEDDISLLIENLNHKDSRVRTLACVILEKKGEDAVEAGGALVQALGDADYAVGREAANAIASIKPPVEVALQPLINIVRERSSAGPLSSSAMHAIGAFGEEAFSAIPFLKEIMENHDDDLRGVAAINLLKIDPGDSDAPLVIVAELENRSGTERSELLRALYLLDEVPSEAFPVLLDLLKVGGMVVPILIGRIGVEPGVVESLIEVVEEDDKRLYDALWALGEIGPEARDAIQLLSIMATDREYPFTKRAAAIEVLGKMGTEPGAVEAIAVVAIEMREYDLWEDERIPRILWSGLTNCFNSLGKLSMPSLIDALNHPNPGVREYAALAFSRLHEEGYAALPVLLSLITEDPDGEVRAVAASVIKSFPKEPQIIPVLVDALDDEYWQVINNAIFTLSFFGNEAQQAIPHLLKLWDHPTFEVRRALLGSLHKISHGPEVFDLYMHALEDDSLAWNAANGLRNLGAAAADALPALERLAEKEYDESVEFSPAKAAEKAIMKIREALEEGE